MKSFKVTVYPKRVQIEEIFDVQPERIPEQVASVDGCRYQYFVKRDKDCDNKQWRDVANNALFYHAKNSGSHVFFIAVNKIRNRKKQEISDKQHGLWGGNSERL